jgi:uncharacterized membrane protein
MKYLDQRYWLCFVELHYWRRCLMNDLLIIIFSFVGAFLASWLFNR